MAGINWDSILAKANASLKLPHNVKKIEGILDLIITTGKFPTGGGVTGIGNGSFHTPDEVANKFVEVLEQTISSSGLSSKAITAISNFDHSAPYGVGGGKYTITVYFRGDLSRESLGPQKYPEGIDNLAELLNDGVDHTMKRVWGTWHGEHYGSRTVIPGAHFMEEAVNTFMSSYAKEYGVIDITINHD